MTMTLPDHLCACVRMLRVGSQASDKPVLYGGKKMLSWQIFIQILLLNWWLHLLFEMKSKVCFEGSYRCYCVTFFVVNAGHISYVNTHFSPNSFIWDTLFMFCPCSIKVTESTWKCVTMFVIKNICVKILLHADIRARNAALERNYFSISVAPGSLRSLPFSSFLLN